MDIIKKTEQKFTGFEFEIFYFILEVSGWPNVD